MALARASRFGHHDRLGSLHHLDDAARARAAASVHEGRSVSLGRPLAPAASRRHDGKASFSLELFQSASANGQFVVGSDHVELDCHGHTNTHIDALNHLGFGGSFYSGWALDDPEAPSVTDLVAHGIVTRAVLADVTKVRGTPWVDAAAPVQGADIERALGDAGVTLEPGDALLLYMGRDRFEAAGHTYTPYTDAPMPGVGSDAARWVGEQRISLLAWDFLDATHPDEPGPTIHWLLWAIGLVLVDNADFSRAVPALAASHRASAAITVSPLDIRGATGCNVNPTLLL
ncbi:MAG: hypothetical protein JWO68_3383 [Actinomycetia bacterium]|nr:hypothetical protein [Actinomycetes bacterium]